MLKTRWRAYLGLVVLIALAALVVIESGTIYAYLARLFGLLTPLWIGVIFYYVFHRPALWLSAWLRRISRKWPRFLGQHSFFLATSLLYLLFIGLLTLLLFLVIPSLARSLTDFFLNFQTYVAGVNRWAEDWKNYLSSKKLDPSILSSLQTQLSSLGGEFTTWGLHFARGLIGSTAAVVGNFFIALLLSLYLLFGDQRIRGFLHRLISAIWLHRSGLVLHVLRTLDRTLSSYFFVQVTEGLILGLLCFIVFTILGVPYASLLSIMIALLALVPVVGAWIACALGTAMLLLVQPSRILFFLIPYIVMQQVEGNFIYPSRVNDSIGLPSLLTLLAVLVGGGMNGVPGALLAVPLASTLFQLLQEWIACREGKDSPFAENAEGVDQLDKSEDSAL